MPGTLGDDAPVTEHRDMTVNKALGADWTVTCACGERFSGTTRSSALQQQRIHRLNERTPDGSRIHVT